LFSIIYGTTKLEKIKVVDKNGKEKLVVDFATADINKFSLVIIN
jgi:hypothetical protein